MSVVTAGLNGPNGLKFGVPSIFVAEQGANRIAAVDPYTGATSASVTGLVGPSAVTKVGTELVITTAGAETPDSSIVGDASVLVAQPGGAPTVLADLEAYELANNPDGQLQFDPDTGAPLDALSNPFAIVERRDSGFVLVADAGANAVLAVSRSGQVSTYFVPPLITTGSCAGASNNDPEHVGCDSVPTGLAYGLKHKLYVSTLGSLAPGAGRVYVLDDRNGRVVDVRGLNGPTGVQVAADGTVYVTEVLSGGGAGPPGRIVRIAPNGTRSSVRIPFPTGIDIKGGVLYVSALSLAGPGAGQILAVRPTAFS